MHVHFLCAVQILESVSPQKIARRLEAEQQEIITTGLEACQIESDSEHLDTKSEDVTAEISEALAAFNDANHKFLSAKEVSKEKLVESRNKLGAASEEVQGLFQTLQDVREVLWVIPLSYNVYPPGEETGRNACGRSEG